MKIIAAVPCALLVVSVLGCSQASTAPAAAQTADPRPSSSSAPSSNVNTFGESKDPAADAAQAREHTFGGSAQDASRQANAPEPANPSAPRP